MFPNLFGLLLTINDSRNDSFNPSCLFNRTGWRFDNSIQSSLTIRSGSLQSNRTYQFMVQMENRRNSSQQATGYVLVKVENTRAQLIAIGCVIVTMCSPNLEYQLVNPTTQVALFSITTGSYLRIENITWNIYSGEMNSSGNYSQWTLFNRTNNWFFGKYTSNFTATNQLFLNNPQIKLWKFEVVYRFLTETSISALNFIINQPPSNGSCSISPKNGTTSTSFNILCPNWFDEDGIKDYSFYVWTTTTSSHKMIIAFSSMSTFQVLLPAGDDQTAVLYLMVEIRDQLNCITQYNMSSITVWPDVVVISDLISNLQNPIAQLLASGDQNTVGQVLTIVSQQVNMMSTETVAKAVSSGVPAASISISSLGSQPLSSIRQFNQSAFIEFNKDLNLQANTREYLMSFTTDLAMTTSNGIILQSSSLAQLTKSTNQLTRKSLVIASDRCYQLSVALESVSTRIAYEDIQIAATQLTQCAANILSAVNGPLQQRTPILDSDQTSASTFPDDYDTNIESEWSKINLFNVDETNSYYQQKLASQIQKQMNQLNSKLTAAFNIHLNVGQQSIMNTSEVYMSLETQSIQSLSNKQLKQVGDAAIYLPSTFQTNTDLDSTVSIRVCSLVFFHYNLTIELF